MGEVVGSFPWELATDSRLSPFAVTRNEVTVLLPAFTTNSSLPSLVMSIEPDVSTIGNPNGGSDLLPLPPVATDPSRASVPFVRRVYMITWFPDGSLVAV